MDIGERYVQRAERKANERMPLSSGQHILHLLLTVFTGGLWIPVWIIRGLHGNPRPFAGEVYRQPYSGQVPVRPEPGDGYR